MTATDTPVNNGVNVEALLGARAALTDAPQAAQFQWRATCEWKNGTHSHSTVDGFFGLGEEQRGLDSTEATQSSLVLCQHSSFDVVVYLFFECHVCII